MRDSVSFEIANDDDLTQIGDLRWRLETDDAENIDPEERGAYIRDFTRALNSEENCGALVHWVARNGEQIIGVMSVRIVNKIPKPEKLGGRWGYLTNVYLLPEYRNDGTGAGLLADLTAWARTEELELLFVWPSDDAYSFYERAGFERRRDPLVLEFSENE